MRLEAISPHVSPHPHIPALALRMVVGPGFDAAGDKLYHSLLCTAYPPMRHLEKVRAHALLKRKQWAAIVSCVRPTHALYGSGA